MGFGGLAAIVVILGLAWVMVPKDRIINFALDQVEAQIGRDISVGGDADLKIFPNLVVVADRIGCFGFYGGAFWRGYRDFPFVLDPL